MQAAPCKGNITAAELCACVETHRRTEGGKPPEYCQDMRLRQVLVMQGREEDISALQIGLS
jgi:hypothetical protein